MTRRPNSEADRHYMRIALALAAEALGATSPNPAVGCVLVKGGRVIAKAATAAGGRPHAEARALEAAGARARGATAYVSFEPCAHQGKTPPCARALIEVGVSRVVVGCVDPYPRVRGRGISMLRRAGIDVTTGVLEDECQRLNEGFITRVKRGRPFTILKLAVSLDGKIAAASGDSRWISSPQSRELVHRWRRECDAVMVGAGTVIADNPRLTCRIRGGRDPIRVVIDGRLRVSPEAQIFHIRSRAPAILVTTNANLANAKRRYESPRTGIIGARSHGNEIALADMMREFGRRGWSKVMIEGGAHLAGAALRAGIVDRIALFVAPKIIGDGLNAIAGLKSPGVRNATQFEWESVRRIGDDFLLQAKSRRSSRR